MPTLNAEVFIMQPQKVGVYQTYGGGKSTQVLDTKVVFENGLSVLATIWARTARDKDTGEESTTISPGLPKGVSFETEEQRDELMELVMACAMVDLGFKGAEYKALLRLDGTRKVGTAGRYTLSAKDMEARKAPAAPVHASAGD